MILGNLFSAVLQHHGLSSGRKIRRGTGVSGGWRILCDHERLYRHRHRRRNRSSVVISQFLGAGKLAKMKTAVYTTMFNFLGIAAFLAAGGILFNNRILNLVNVPEDIFSDAALYLAIYFIGLPFLFMYNVQASIFNALGDSKKPLYLLIFSSLLNIALDMILVIVFKQECQGRCAGDTDRTGISAVISFLLFDAEAKGVSCRGAGASLQRRDGGLHGEDRRSVHTAAVHRTDRNFAGPVCDQQLRLHGNRRILRRHADRVIKYRADARNGNAMSTFTAQNMGPERSTG